jgi:hypothetical protein
MVALWAEEGFHGLKRTLIEDDLDLTKTYFNDKTHAIAFVCVGRAPGRRHRAHIPLPCYD